MIIGLDTVSQVVLKPFFQREEIMYNLPLYIMEKYIRDYKLDFDLKRNDGTSAHKLVMDYFLDLGLEIEN